MNIPLLATNTANLNLTIAPAIISPYTPSSTVATYCSMYVKMGATGHLLDGTGGTFILVLKIGGVSVSPSVEPVVNGGLTTTVIYVPPFMVPANTSVQALLLSPNGADTSVAVTTNLYDVGAVDAVAWLGTSIVSPATAGTPDVNTKTIANAAISPITTASPVPANMVTVQGTKKVVLATVDSGAGTTSVTVTLDGSEDFAAGMFSGATIEFRDTGYFARRTITTHTRPSTGKATMAFSGSSGAPDGPIPSGLASTALAVIY